VPKQLLKLMFAVVVLLLVVPFRGSSLLASGNNWCSCYGYAWLYYDDGGSYGGHEWAFLYELDYDAHGSLDNPFPDGGTVCFNACYGQAQYAVGLLCNTYSNPSYAARHYQIQIHYMFDDFDNTSGGSVDDWFDTGTSFLYCP
jgi:hypothetical protein